MFWFIWPSGFRAEDSNVKKLIEDKGQVISKAHIVFGQNFVPVLL
jgi:hypothetical protein